MAVRGAKNVTNAARTRYKPPDQTVLYPISGEFVPKAGRNTNARKSSHVIRRSAIRALDTGCPPNPLSV
jgi:hypothetical protein